MAKRSAVALLTLCFVGCFVIGDASFIDTGVPCYLRPTGDRCHYRAKPDSPTCTSADDRRRLTEGARQLNRSIAALEQKLIRLGIIPPDNACSKLPAIENGAVVYSDLNLGAGCVGRYICNDGYTLQTLRGQKEFACDEYGVWDGDVITAPVKCLLTVDQCVRPANISDGVISYEDSDSNNIFIGNRIEYHCTNGTELHGSQYRFCQRNGNWSGSEPECKEVKTTQEEVTSESNKLGLDHILKISLGAGFGVLAFIIVVVVIGVTVKLVKPSFKKWKEGHGRASTGLTIVDEYDNQDEDLPSKETVRYMSFGSPSKSSTSSEATVNVVKKLSKKSKKSKHTELEESIM